MRQLRVEPDTARMAQFGVSLSQIEQALRGLKLFPLLDGYRGRAKADMGAAVDAVAGMGLFFADDRGSGTDPLDAEPPGAVDAGRAQKDERDA